MYSVHILFFFSVLVIVITKTTLDVVLVFLKNIFKQIKHEIDTYRWARFVYCKTFSINVQGYGKERMPYQHVA